MRRAATRKRPSPAAPLESASGRGRLLVAVIDSGITAGHPHVGPVAGGASFTVLPGGTVARREGAPDRIGHGTACAAVIRQMLPRAGLLAVRVFHHRLEADQRSLSAAIRWAVERGARLLNLSLWAPRAGRGTRGLAAACREAARSGAAIIAARPPSRFRPAGGLFELPGVIAAGADPRCLPGRFRRDPLRPGSFLASPLARPAPGIPAAANFHGPSLAAARLTGFAGKIIEREGPLPPGLLRRRLEDWANRLSRSGPRGLSKFAVEIARSRPVELAHPSKLSKHARGARRPSRVSPQRPGGGVNQRPQEDGSANAASRV